MRRRSGADRTQPHARVRDTPEQYRILGALGGTNEGMSGCLDCGLEVDHCHGTLVVHDDHTVDCTDTACELPDLLRHPLIVDCIAVLGGCCRTEDAADLAIAS